MNYSCLPNEDGSLKGSKRASMSVGMDIDFNAPKELSAEEQQGVRKVLTAAALTYVAAVASSLLTLMRLLLIRGRRR